MKTDADNFRSVVTNYILKGGNVRLLADTFETAPDTIARWANGTAKPRPAVMTQVESWIHEHQ